MSSLDNIRLNIHMDPYCEVDKQAHAMWDYSLRRTAAAAAATTPLVLAALDVTRAALHQHAVAAAAREKHAVEAPRLCLTAGGSTTG